MDGDMGNSARTSLISSVDSCYTADSAHLARLLAAAAAADTMSGRSLSGKQKAQEEQEVVELPLLFKGVYQHFRSTVSCFA